MSCHPRFKKWIDKASYTELLRKWREAPAGDPMFRDANGVYYKKVLAQRSSELTQEERVAASKEVGWDGTQG